MDSILVIRSLHIITHQTDEIFDRLLRKEFGLTLARFRIFMPLIEIGPLTQAEIARFHFVTEASVARQIRLLMQEGYLKRIPDKTDGRKFIIQITAKTEALLPQIKKRLNETLNQVYSKMAPSEMKTIYASLGKLQEIGSEYTKDLFRSEML